MDARIVADSGVLRTGHADEIRRAHAEARAMWVDLAERTPEVDRLLAETFQIHPVAVEDLWADRRIPKVESFGTYLHILVHGAKRGSLPTQIVTWTLSIVLGKTFVITHAGAPGRRPELENAGELLREGPSRLAHAFLDSLVDGHVALIEDLGRQVERAEPDVMESTTPVAVRPFVAGLFELRRSMQTLARMAHRQLDAIAGLHEGRFPLIPTPMVPYFRDVYDHFVRVSDLIDDYQQVLNNTFEAVVQLQSARINSVMKTLTVLSTIMLPLTFIASVFGMNFRNLPGAQSPWGFVAVLAGMAATAAAFGLFFRRKGWL
jgi:magnesium transporter